MSVLSWHGPLCGVSRNSVSTLSHRAEVTETCPGRENQRILDSSPPTTEEDAGSSLPHPIRHIRDSIPSILAGMPGKAAHAALQRLVVEKAGTAQGKWLQGFVLHHASAEAERQSVGSAAELLRLGDVYCREPRTAGELYEQVLARLQEIREGMEGGPFSDRALFAPGIDEKKLQLWLAARLSDTPLRRFIPRFRVH